MYIAVSNQATRISGADVEIATQAVAQQVAFDLSPAWGRLPVPVVYYRDPSHAPAGSYPIVLFDDADQAGALGYHDETPQGQVYGRVFVGPVLDNGGDALHSPLSVASVLSHETLETAIDPQIDLWADDGKGTLFAAEVGDPVEADSYPISVPGAAQSVTVSNFVLPSWFDDTPPAGARFDYLGKLTAPFSLDAQGYVIYRTGAGQPQQRFGESYPAWKQATKQHRAARTAKRLNLF